MKTMYSMDLIAICLVAQFHYFDTVVREHVQISISFLLRISEIDTFSSIGYNVLTCCFQLIIHRFQNNLSAMTFFDGDDSMILNGIHSEMVSMCAYVCWRHWIPFNRNLFWLIQIKINWMLSGYHTLQTSCFFKGLKIEYHIYICAIIMMELWDLMLLF